MSGRRECLIFRVQRAQHNQSTHNTTIIPAQQYNNPTNEPQEFTVRPQRRGMENLYGFGTKPIGYPFYQ